MIRMHNDRFFFDNSFPFAALIYTIQPGQNIEEHSHEFVEMAYVAEGTGEHSYEGGEYYEIRSGDVFVIEPDRVHAYRVGSQDKLVVYNILFTPSLLKAELEAISSFGSFVDFFYVEPFLRNEVHFNTRLTLLPKQQLEMRGMLERLKSEHNDKNLGYQLLIKTIMIELFVFLSRCYSLLSDSVHPKRQAKEIQHILEFIHRHYSQPLTLEQISHICGLSISAFSFKFKQLTGQPLIEYRNEIRIQAAQEALAGSDEKIANISHNVGFEDLSFFNKLFKKKTGLSPGGYRRHLHGWAPK
jgi:AraC-like DNA-binding protein/quercetin dioxygenase-like cupin family protein